MYTLPPIFGGKSVTVSHPITITKLTAATLVCGFLSGNILAPPQNSFACHRRVCRKAPPLRLHMVPAQKALTNKKLFMSGHLDNVYTLLSLDNPEIYRDLTPPEDLPLSIYDELPA